MKNHTDKFILNLKKIFFIVIGLLLWHTDYVNANDSKSNNNQQQIVDFNDIQDPDLLAPQLPIKLTATPGANSLYRRAYQLYSKLDYKNALQTFNDFIEQYPKDHLVVNSYYVIGSIYFEIKQFDLAEQAFRYILQNFDRQEKEIEVKAIASIFMLGLINEQKKNITLSRYYFYKVIDLYSYSSYAQLAKEKLGWTN